jgi:hypothetical protein
LCTIEVYLWGLFIYLGPKFDPSSNNFHLVQLCTFPCLTSALLACFKHNHWYECSLKNSKCELKYLSKDILSLIGFLTCFVMILFFVVVKMAFSYKWTLFISRFLFLLSNEKSVSCIYSFILTPCRNFLLGLSRPLFYCWTYVSSPLVLFYKVFVFHFNCLLIQKCIPWIVPSFDSMFVLFFYASSNPLCFVYCMSIAFLK